MRDLETLVVDCLVAVEQDVEVDVTRTLIDDLLASHIVLNGLELIQQSYGFQLRLNLVKLVNKHKVTNMILIYIPRTHR